MTKGILVNAWWLFLLGGLAIQILHGGFKIATDIVEYFRIKPLHHIANPFRAVAAAFSFDINSPSSLRGQLTRRLGKLLDDLDGEFGPFDRVDIVAHSLGTMLAIETLSRNQEARVRTKIEWRLITLGSPYTHIFQHYLPHVFPTAAPDNVGVAQWVNIYRANDYVGTTIDGNRVDNREHPPRGHLDYFSDSRVVKLIVDAMGGVANEEKGQREPAVAS